MTNSNVWLQDYDVNWWDFIPKDEEEYIKKWKNPKTDFESYCIQLSEYNGYRSSSHNSTRYKEYRKYYIKWGIIEEKKANR